MTPIMTDPSATRDPRIRRICPALRPANRSPPSQSGSAAPLHCLFGRHDEFLGRGLHRFSDAMINLITSTDDHGRTEPS